MENMIKINKIKKGSRNFPKPNKTKLLLLLERVLISFWHKDTAR